MTQPSLLREWHQARSEFFERAAEDTSQAVSRFLKDWAVDAGVRVMGAPTTRVKTVERIWAKLYRKMTASPGLEATKFDDLLKVNSAVGDLVGIRFVVRGLSDLKVLLDLMKENDFLADTPFHGTSIDNMNFRPRVTGYRAVHVNTCAEVTIRSTSVSVPIEIQIKTGLQDSWGTFTHDIAYARTDLYGDPQFIRLRELQRLLADSLDVADQLNRSVEEMYGDFVASRTLGDSTAGLDLDSILSTVSEIHGVTMSIESATRILDTAKFCGFNSVGDFYAVANDQDELQLLAEGMEATAYDRPEIEDLLIKLMESRIGTIHKGFQEDRRTDVAEGG